MSIIPRRVALLLPVLILAACSFEGTAPVAPPPPLPTLPQPTPAEPASPEPAGEVEGAPDEADAPVAAEAEAPEDDKPSAKGEPSPTKTVEPAKKGASLYDIDPKATQGAEKPKTTATPTKPTLITPKLPSLATTTKPEPKPEAPAPEPKPTPAFNVPSAPHVTLDLPQGLRDDLAKDTRMTPWLKKGLSAASSCYTKQNDAKLAGTIVVNIVMHENDRPDASIQTLPGQLSGVFACVSGAMMKNRMPLFTGKEGQRYTAKVRFAP
jgi:hypothetical protein